MMICSMLRNLEAKRKENKKYELEIQTEFCCIISNEDGFGAHRKISHGLSFAKVASSFLT